MAAVLVTGAAGFIGSHAVEALLDQGHAVTALDDLSGGSWSNLPDAHPRLTLATADVRDPGRVGQIVHGRRFDAIVHLAGWASTVASLEQPALAHAIHVDGTLNVLEAARTAGVRRFVLASSALVYGAPDVLPTDEEQPLRPITPYAAHKAEAEMLCAAYRAAYAIETVPLRLFNVYGPRQRAADRHGGVVMAFARRLLAREPIELPGDGARTRDFVHVSDVAAVSALAATGPDPAGALNVGSGEQCSLRRLATLLGHALGFGPCLVSGPERPGDAPAAQADIGRLRRRLGYAPAVGLEDGLRRLAGELRPSPDTLPGAARRAAGLGPAGGRA